MDEPKASTSGIKKGQVLSESESSSSEEYDEESKEKLLTVKVSDDYDDELEEDLSKQKKGIKRVRKKVSRMPPHLMGLMGEANLRFARGELEMCEKMCFEIIRQVPLAFEPYVTLSQLYEGVHLEKCIQYLTIASHLKPYDVDQWCRLAQMHITSGNKRKAITCYTKALQCQPQDYDIQKRRIEALQELGDDKFVTKCQVRFLHTLNPAAYAEELMSLSKELAHKYHLLKDYSKAIEVLNVAFQKLPDKITPDFVNIMLELLLLNQNYPECLDVFVQFCSIEMEVFIEENNQLKILNYNIPRGIQIDLRIKFIVCLVKLHAFDLMPSLIDPLIIEEDVEQVGDLFLDVAEALMSVNKPEIALKLLIPLIKSKNFFLAAVWLKYAECLEACRMYEQSIDSYMTVVRMAPQHLEVRHTLSALLIKNGKCDEALAIMSHDVTSGDLDVDLLVKKIKLLREMDRFDDYCKAMDLLYSRHCIMAKRYEEIQLMTMLDRYSEKASKIRKIRQIRLEDDFVTYNCLNEPSVEAEMALIKDCFQYCYQKKRFEQLQKYSFQVLMVSRFKSYFDEIYFTCFYTALYNSDAYHAYRIVRELIFHNPNSTFLWNLLNMCPKRIDKVPKFVLRFTDNIDNDILKVFEANSALYATKFTMAAMNIMPFFKERRPPPYICMFMGVLLAQICKQRGSKMKTKLTQTVYTLFFRYANNRGKEAQHETFYNLGRMYQYFGISHLALHYYKKVLLEGVSPVVEKHLDVLDLRREAAFNLFLLYKECENYVQAKEVLIKYLTIWLRFFFMIFYLKLAELESLLSFRRLRSMFKSSIL